MKRFLYILAAALVAAVSPATSQVFRSVEWGMTRDQVAAAEGDADMIRDTSFGIPAVVRFEYAASGLSRIDVDLTRAHDAANTAVLVVFLQDVNAVHPMLVARYGSDGSPGGIYRDSACGATDLERLVAGCLWWRASWLDRSTSVVESLDAGSGRFVHRIEYRPSGPSSVSEPWHAPLHLDLR